MTRMADKVAVVVGAGQTEGETIGNGRAIAIRLAQEGATVLAVDRDLASAEETCWMIRDLADGPSAEATEAFRADITDEPGGDNAGGNAEANAGGTGDNVTDAEYEEVK